MLDKGKPEDVMPSVKGAQVSQTPLWAFSKGTSLHLCLLEVPAVVFSTPVFSCLALLLVPLSFTMLLCPQERLPAVPLSGMYNKSGGKVRLTFKLEQDQLWIGTKGTGCPRLFLAHCLWPQPLLSFLFPFLQGCSHSLPYLSLFSHYSYLFVIIWVLA